ncbi:MAG: YceD family protein [Actinomycetota bacterium]
MAPGDHNFLQTGQPRVQQLSVSVAELLGRPGAFRDIELSAPLPGVGVELARLTDDPIGARLRVQSVVEGILVTGRVEGATEVRCARCLTGLGSGVELEVCELFIAPGHEDPADDSYRVAGSEIHLEPMLRDAIALALPLHPLCRRDCKGICARCGAALNDGECDCREDGTDPRWAPLDALRAKLEDRSTA